MELNLIVSARPRLARREVPRIVRKGDMVRRQSGPVSDGKYLIDNQRRTQLAAAAMLRETQFQNAQTPWHTVSR